MSTQTPIDDYIATLDGEVQQLFRGMQSLILEVVPSAVQGVSYAMSAYLYKGKGLISFVQAKKFLSMYPFSGKVIAKLESRLTNFEHTSGAIHFSVEHPIPQELLRDILLARVIEIDAKNTL